MRFAVRRVEQIRLEPLGATDHRIVGPDEIVAHLLRACGDRPAPVHTSPPAVVTIGGQSAARSGVPEGAHTFAFAYPMRLTAAAVDELVRIAVRERSRAGSRSDDTPAWLDFCLIGGFVYFDAKGALLQANALGLQLGMGNPELTYDGPHLASTRAGGAMMRAGRMEAVTLDSLKDEGFVSFGWLNPFGWLAPPPPPPSMPTASPLAGAPHVVELS